MRKKNYLLLYPMMGIAFVVVIAILIGHYCFGCFTDKTQWRQDAAVFEAVVISPTVKHNKVVSCDLQVVNINGEGEGKKISAAFFPDEMGIFPHFKIGDGIIVKSKIERDTTKYARREMHGHTLIFNGNWRRKVICLTSLSDWDRTRIRMLQLRESLLERLHTNLNDSGYPIIAAMTLGDKSNLSKETKQLFSQTGVSHVLALSGLHIGLIFFFLSILITPLFPTIKSRRIAHAFIVIPIWMFVLLVGMPVSAIRSATMITIYAITTASGRGKVPFNTLCFAAVVILIVSPLSLFDIGFQLSFLSVAGIIVCYPILYETIDQQWLIKHGKTSKLWSMTCISVTAQLSTFPLVAYYFGTFSTYFLVANYVIVPLTTVILYITIIYFLAMPIAFLQHIIGMILSGIAWFMTAFLGYLSSLPGATISDLHPDKIEVSMLYLVVILFFSWWNRNNAKRAELLLSAILLLICYSTLT